MGATPFWLFAAAVWIAPVLFLALMQMIRSFRIRCLVQLFLLIVLSFLGLSRLFALSLGIFLPCVFLGAVVASSSRTILRFGYVIPGIAMLLLIGDALHFLNWNENVMLGFWAYLVIAMVPPLNRRINSSTLSSLAIAAPAAAFFAMISAAHGYLSELELTHSPAHENRAFLASLAALAVLIVISLFRIGNRYVAASAASLAMAVMVVPVAFSLPPDLRVWIACALMIAVGFLAGRRGTASDSRTPAIKRLGTIAGVLTLMLAFQLAPLVGYEIDTGVGNVFLSYVVFIPFIGLIAVPYGLAASLWFPSRPRVSPKALGSAFEAWRARQLACLRSLPRAVLAGGTALVLTVLAASIVLYFSSSGQTFRIEYTLQHYCRDLDSLEVQEAAASAFVARHDFAVALDCANHIAQPLQKIRVLSGIAAAMIEGGDNVTARKVMLQALPIKDLWVPDNRWGDVVEMYRILGATLGRAGDPQAKAFFEKAKELADQKLQRSGATLADIAKSIVDTALAGKDHRLLEYARLVAEDAITSASRRSDIEGGTPSRDVERVRTLSTIATIMARMGDSRRAEELFEHAGKVASEIDEGPCTNCTIAYKAEALKSIAEAMGKAGIGGLAGRAETVFDRARSFANKMPDANEKAKALLALTDAMADAAYNLKAPQLSQRASDIAETEIGIPEYKASALISVGISMSLGGEALTASRCFRQAQAVAEEEIKDFGARTNALALIAVGRAIANKNSDSARELLDLAHATTNSAQHTENPYLKPRSLISAAIVNGLAEDRQAAIALINEARLRADALDENAAPLQRVQALRAVAGSLAKLGQMRTAYTVAMGRLGSNPNIFTEKLRSNQRALNLAAILTAISDPGWGRWGSHFESDALLFPTL